MIKIHNFEPVSQGCKVAVFDVELPNMGFAIKRMTLLESKGRTWVSYPTGCKQINGENKFFGYFKFMDEKRDKEFLTLVQEEAQKLLNATPQAESVDTSGDLPF